jgi:hypothetical protein
MAYVPPGCTGLVQPADVSWNRSFKVRSTHELECIGFQCHFRELRDTWLAQNTQRARTAGGRETAPPVEQVLKWIALSWAAVPAEQIIESFRACGLTANVDNSNVVDGMTCFKHGGQLHSYVDAFKAALSET